jgi:3-deoxy-manno-octulosonate cytidylyltransferase (CMP-KDO synthetase)
MAVIIIPARKGSTRLKDKLLLEVKGKPIIYWTAENCRKVSNVDKVIVATDSEEIRKIFRNEKGIDAVITPSNLKSGSDRVAFVAKELKEEKIINVQGDEPLLDPKDIEKVVDGLDEAEITSLYFPIEDEDHYINPNIVKVVLDKENYALYFSRSPIPFYRDISFEEMKKKYEKIPAKHIGVYGYKKEVLLKFAYELNPSPIEEIEKLEQLRLLYNGYRIKLFQANKDTVGIDTKEDYQHFCKLVEGEV